MPLEMVLGSKFPWKPGQALPSSVSWLGWAGARREGAGAQAPLGGHRGGALAYGGVHTRAPSANSLPGLLLREDEGPTAASREREGWNRKGLGGGDVGSPPTPSLRLQPTQQLTHSVVTPISTRQLHHCHLPGTIPARVEVG